MKSEEEVRKQLETLYERRLALRIERKTKRGCRNCVRGVCREFDLGDFGTMSRWECPDGLRPESERCGFQCRNTAEEIEREMLSDIADPSICGAKEQKIAMLMWVLHDGDGGSRGASAPKPGAEGEDGFLGKIWRLFK